MGMQSKYLTAKDLAVYMSVSRTMVDRLVESGRLLLPTLRDVIESEVAKIGVTP